MKAIAQNEIVSLILDLNNFADRADAMVQQINAETEKNRALMEARQKNALNELDNNYRNVCSSIQNQAKNTGNEAQRILTEVNRLDERLSKADKYYQKTKKKKEASLAGTISDAYTDATDYFRAFENIRKEFNRLFRKYTEDILPGLLNGLNYLFSSQRKQDYEDLIVLRNTVDRFVSEIRSTLPGLTEEQLAKTKESYDVARGTMQERIKRENAAQEQARAQAMDQAANQIYDELDKILPDEFVEYLRLISAAYVKTSGKVNQTGAVANEILNLAYLDYPVTELVNNRIIASVILEKCASLRVGNAVRFPVMMSTSDAPVWTIINDNSNAAAVQSLVHSIMYGVLAACPVARMNYTVVDPENRGNSIEPFFDAKKKLPELFGDKILIHPDDVSQTVSRLNETIEDMLQNRLGNQYSNVFDYAQDNPDYALNAELLVLFDFPRGFDERTIAALRNVLRNGSRCGIYTVISYLPDREASYTRDFQQSLQSILELSVQIQQQDNSFYYRGLPLVYYYMPEKEAFGAYFSRYMLIYEGIKNRGIAFSPLVKKLAEAKTVPELEDHIRCIGAMLENYRQSYAEVPELRAQFPSQITLGNVLYPADIFSDSVDPDLIRRAFGVQLKGRSESSDYVELPLSFDLGNTFNLLLKCPEAESREIRSFTHHLIWSFLSFVPVTKTNICIFDSEQRGNSVIPFLDFRKRAPELFDEKIYTGQEESIERLRRINAQIDEFIQNKLGNQYKNILEYNLHTPARAEPLTLLVIYDFPAGMDSRTLDLLTNILRNGNKCGVYTILCHNPGVTYSRYENLDDRIAMLGKYCASMDYRNGHYELLPYNLQVNLPEFPDAAAQTKFISTYVERIEQVKKQGLSFRDILPEELFSGDASKSLRIPVGIGDGDSIVNLILGSGSSHHGLVAGATGSGKSTLLHTLIMSAMLCYTPEQLHLYLMDFKSGTEFKIYESVPLPHIQLLALDAMQEFGESILENLVSEMEQRGSLFKSAGQTSLNGYVQATGKPMPRILVIMDEFQILFNDSANRKVALNCAELAKRIVTEGRAFGIHLLMATQSTKVISDLTLSHGTVEQMRIRIGLKCSDSDARYLFSDESEDKVLSMMKGPIGTAVMNLDYTEQSSIGFRAAYCDNDTQRELLELISKTFADRPYNLQTFEGGRTTALLDYFNAAGIQETDTLPVQIHMGTLIKVAPPFAISIDRKKKHNMLICGANDRMAALLANDYIISALLNRNAEVYCIDGDKMVGDEGDSALYNAILDSPAGGRFHLAENRADIIRFFRDVYQQYLAWKKKNTDEVVFFVIKNLQFLDIVKSMLKGANVDESEFLDEEPPAAEPEDDLNPFAAVANMFASRSSGGSEDNTSAGEKLRKLVDDGSGFGIHFVLTTVEYQTVKECLYYGENLLSKFPERIIFSLGGNDADSLVENVSLNGLRDNTVVFTDGVKNTFQMKPYLPPKPEELREDFRTRFGSLDRDGNT